jgi:hypothetical protein
MFNPEFTQEAMAMTDAKPQFVSSRPVLRAALLLPAAALIFIGSVFQLGVLGYGQMNPRDLWPAVLVVQAAWNLLAVHLNAPQFGDLFQFWPLLLVALGLAIALMLKPVKSLGRAPRPTRGRITR